METNIFFTEKNRNMSEQTLSSFRGQFYQKQTWAVGGGKGGVGKSLISSSLAFTLAKNGISTIIIDLDLGGANLHTVLGQAPPAKCLSDFLNGSVPKLQDCVTPTNYPHLQLIGGAKDDLKITELTQESKNNLLNQIKDLKAQFIILDLGAGTSAYTLDFFNFATVGIITALPEPTSIENAYRFLKASYYNRLLDNAQFEPIRPLIEAAMRPNNALGIQSPQQLLSEVSFHHPQLAIELKSAIKQFQPKLMINQIRSQTDIDVGFSMKSVAKKYFGIDFDYLGYLEYEPNVWQSVRKMKPILSEFPYSRLAIHVERIVNYLLKQAKIEHTLKD